MTTESPSPIENPPPAHSPRPGRKLLVLSIVAGCMALFCVLVAVIFIKWQREPIAELVVQPGNSWLDGTTLVITGNSDKDMQLTLDATNNYGGRIMLVPGHYLVIVKLNGTPVISQPLEIPESPPSTWALPILDSKHQEEFEKLREQSIQTKSNDSTTTNHPDH